MTQSNISVGCSIDWHFFQLTEFLLFLRNNCIAVLEPKLEYLDDTYVNATLRRQRQSHSYSHLTSGMCIRRQSAMKIERQLMGNSNPNVWVTIERIRKDPATVRTHLPNDARWELLNKRVRRETRDIQQRLRNLCSVHRFQRLTQDFGQILHGVGYNNRLY